MTLTSKLPAIVVTTLELHSEQTSSQEQEMLTTSTAKCPEQLIDQKPPVLSAETVNTGDLESSVPSATGPSGIVPSAPGPPALSPSGEEPVSGFMKSVNDAIDKAVKEELMDTDNPEVNSKAVSMETDLTAKDSAQNKKETVDQTVITKQEKSETTERKDSTESDQSVIIIDGRDDGDEKSPDSGIFDDYLSRVVRKLAFCICENKGPDQLRGYYREADQRLCFRYTDSTIPLLPKYEISSL